MNAPVIQTPRLNLRGHTLRDFDACLQMWSSPEVTRYIGGKPSTAEEVWARLHRYVGHWALLGFGYWLVEETDTGRFVGEVGFADFHRDLSPPLDAPESGWALAPWAHGQGFATEALQGALAWGDAHLAGGRSVCMISPQNEPSFRVAAKCGYREWGRVEYRGSPAVLLQRLGRSSI